MFLFIFQSSFLNVIPQMLLLCKTFSRDTIQALTHPQQKTKEWPAKVMIQPK